VEVGGVLHGEQPDLGFSAHGSDGAGGGVDSPARELHGARIGVKTQRLEASLGQRHHVAARAASRDQNLRTRLAPVLRAAAFPAPNAFSS